MMGHLFHKIMNFLFLLLLLCFSNLCFSQNNSYQIFEDSIFPTMDVNYVESKKIYIKYQQKGSYDPQYCLYFLKKSLVNNDIHFFKKEIIYLMKKYGYHYSFFDTLSFQESELDIEIKQLNLSKWLVKKSDKLYPKWIRSNSTYIEMYAQMKSAYSSDQLIRKISFDLHPLILEGKTDSILQYIYLQNYDSLINYIDLKNVLIIKEWCHVNNDIMLNNFDNGTEILRIVSLVITHNFKRKKNLIQTWELLYPFVENAYLIGKIPFDFFYYYDEALLKHYGYQYYGTLGEEIPITDSETYNIRRKKLNL